MEIPEVEKKFAVAALAVFKRFGVRKATMEEIAAEARVSKPTLYATFRNKDAALGGAIRFAKDAALKEVTDAWADTQLSECLDIFMDRLVLRGFDMLHGSPDAEAFDNAVGDFSLSAIKTTRNAEVEAMATVFRGTEKLEAIGIDAESFAEFVVNSAMNAKRLAQTRSELEKYLETLKKVVLAILATDAV